MTGMNEGVVKEKYNRKYNRENRPEKEKEMGQTYMGMKRNSYQ